MTIEKIARVCHEVNRGYCEFLGDTSQVRWEQAPDWQKKSAVNGVVEILRDPTLPPSHSHENWLEEKRASGWGWGIAKDEKLKVHPCFVPYNQLPPEQQAKDHIFGAIARALISNGILDHSPALPAPPAVD